VTVEPGYTRFAGTQDPVTNNGQAATSITLADRDGIMLKAVAPPPPPPGPPSDTVAYWAMDEGSGTTASDSSGNGWTGTLTGGTSWVAGKPGQAVHFDGVSGRMSAGDIPSSSTMTWTFWMRTPTVPAYNVAYGLLDKYIGTNAKREWRVFMMGEDIRLTIAPSTISWYEERIATGFNAVANTWAHVAVVFNNGAFTAYKDGVAVATNGDFTHTEIANRTASVYAGYRQGGGEYFTGDMDEIRIYNRALSSSEVQAIYAYGQ